MLVAWIVITLMLAVVVALIAAGIGGSFERGANFLIGFIVVCQISVAIAVMFIVGHFIGKYW